MTVLRSTLHQLTPILRKLRIIEIPIRLCKGVLGNHIGGKSSIHVPQIDIFATAFELLEPGNQLVDDRLHRWLEPAHRGLGEKFSESSAADAVEFVALGCEA